MVTHIRLSGYYRIFHKLQLHLNKLQRTVKMYVCSASKCTLAPLTVYQSKFEVLNLKKKIKFLTNVYKIYDVGTFLKLLTCVNHLGDEGLSF